MGPDHGYLSDFHLHFVGEKQDLRIKSPTGNALERKNLLRGLACECFEAALCIVIRKPQEPAQIQVVEASQNLALERLALHLKGRIEPARSDGHVSALFHLGEELHCLGDWGREIGISEQKHLAARLQHAVAHRIALAAVARIPDKTHFRICNGVMCDQFRSAVSRAIVNHYHFSVPLLPADVRDHLVERGANALALVVGRDNNAVFWLCLIQAGTIPRELLYCQTHAACSRFLSMAKNADTSSGSHRPWRASSSMVCSASS